LINRISHISTTSIELRDKSVIKYFSSADSYWKEFKVYEKGLPMVPKLLSSEEPKWIEIEYVEGKPYLNVQPQTEIIDLLADTLGNFHKAMRTDNLYLCHWDNQPSNILYSRNQIWLLDFSESRTSVVEDDITHLLLFWCAEFSSDKLRSLVDKFISRYQIHIPLNAKIWKDALTRSLIRFNQRRSSFGHSLHHLEEEQFNLNVNYLSNLFNSSSSN
jgi:tRNA A-37 threonylcarbamoyl transferase component Bud32